MNTRCDPDTLDSAEGTTHAASCTRCARELAWRRAEERLMRERRTPDVAVDALWNTVAARLPAAPSVAQSPYRASVAAPLARVRRPLKTLAVALAAGVVVSVGAAALTRRVAPTRSPAVTLAPIEMRPPCPRPLPRLVTPVAGAITLRVEAWAGDVHITTHEKLEVDIQLEDPAIELALEPSQGRYVARFNGGRLANGAVEIKVPLGSSVDVSTSSGGIHVTNVADVHLETASGDVSALNVQRAEITSASGDVNATVAAGVARVETVSGNIAIAFVQHVDAPAAIADVNVVSTSGDVRWSGFCSLRGRVAVRTVSGDVTLAPTLASGFLLRYATVSGDFRDGLHTMPTVAEADGVPRRRFGNGTGVLNIETTSGSLSLQAP